jgi:hypothetical protein
MSILSNSTTVTVLAGSVGTIKVGSLISAVGLSNGTYISAFGTGTGGSGTYVLSTTPTTSTDVSFITSTLPYDPASISLSAGSATCGKIPCNGTAFITVNTTACTPNSLVIGTQWYGGNTSFQMIPNDGFFALQASTAGTGFSFVIIN